MAIFHDSITIVTRGKGKSAVAVAAYQSGTKMVNEWDGVTHDYTRKKGVVYSEIMLPENAPASLSDRYTLWNSVELRENRCNAQLARSMELSFPIELGFEENLKIAHDYFEHFREDGMVVDFSIHDPDEDNHNPHVHVLLTMRPLDENGHWGEKSKSMPVLDESGEPVIGANGKKKTYKLDLTGWSDQGNATKWRKLWADTVNKHLEMNGFSERIDHRSNAERGIEEIPQIHMGVAAWAMEKKGIRTERGDINRQIKEANRIIKEIRNKITGLVGWLAAVVDAIKEIQAQPKSPMLGDLMMQYLDLEAQKIQKYAPSFRVKHQSATFNQLMTYLEKLKSKGIYTLEDLENTIKEQKDQNYELNHQVIGAEKRMKELNSLIDNAECLMKYTPIKRELKAIKWKGKREKFEEEHRADLAFWDAANRFLHAKKVDISSLKASVKSWKAELDSLQTQHDTDYAKLKAEREVVKELDEVHRLVEKVLAPGRKEVREQKKQNMEL